MKLVFESERLLFRPLEDSDLDLTIAQWTDPDVARFAVGKTYSEDVLRGQMPFVTRRCAGGCIGNWCVIEKATREKLGTINFLPMPVALDDTDWDLVVGDDIPKGLIELGYIFRKSAWGKGYATEACRRLLKFAYEESPLQEVIASIENGNEASRRVLEKCGFTDIGMIEAYGAPSPGFRITKQDWLRAQDEQEDEL